MISQKKRTKKINFIIIYSVFIIFHQCYDNIHILTRDNTLADRESLEVKKQK